VIRITALILLVALTNSLSAKGPQRVYLWKGKAPGAKGNEPKDRPSLLLYNKTKKKTPVAAVVVCPGGGYGGLAMGHEGHEIAKWFNSFNIAAFILDYRHRGKGYGHPAPLTDAQRAIRLVRANAKKWAVDRERVGIMGFSAGGHLASSTGVYFDKGGDSDDPVDTMHCRPDFMVLCYPVIAFGESFTHRGSQRNLLGAKASKEKIRSMSTEKQINKKTPPTFLFHTTEDRAVPPQNSIHFYLGLKKHGIPAEMHIYEKGRHGVGLGKRIPGTNSWPKRLREWMAGRGLLK